MAPLKSLEKDFPIIDSDFQQFCASHSIFTVEDFLMNDLYVLAAEAEQHYSSERLKQAIAQVLSIIDSQHMPWLNGMELLEDAQQNKNVMSTGCKRIDSFLQGGFRMGQLIELVGPSSSGKTQICLNAASNVARAYAARVVFLDSGNSFSPKRIMQLVSQMSDCAENETDTTLQQVMNRIVCYPVFDVFTLLDVLHQLEDDLRMQTDVLVKLLVVDSISSLITPVLGGGNGAQGHALMVAAGIFLKKLAHEHNLAVLVTNHMVAGEGGISKPALGESWKSIPHVRLSICRNDVSNISTLSILRHPSMAIGNSTEFVF